MYIIFGQTMVQGHLKIAPAADNKSRRQSLNKYK